MDSKFESAYGRAIDIASSGFRLPFALKRELIEEQGMTPEEVMALEARYLSTPTQQYQ